MRSRYGVGCAYLTGWVLGGTSKSDKILTSRFFYIAHLKKNIESVAEISRVGISNK